MIKFFINGEERSIEGSSLTLHQILSHYQINSNSVVVEFNESVVSRNDLSDTEVHDGDKIEIVQFVGGGADNPEEQGDSSSEEKPVADENLGEPSAKVEESVKPAAKKKAVKKKAKKAKKAKKVKKAKKTKKASSSKVKISDAKNLVIVESPAKAKTINKFLGSDYHVEASMGHVRDLPRSKMGVDVESDFTPHYITIRKAMKTVKNLKLQAKGKQEIFLAPDPDREGEAISWHLAHLFKEQDEDAKIKRVVFNEITKDAILNAFQNTREIQMNLVDAQQARRVLDRVVGYELSPLLWRKVGRGLSAGRVQSVALRMIVDREREIKAFVPVEYWSLEASLFSPAEEEKKFLAKLDKIGEEKAELKNKEETQKIRDIVRESTFKVEKVDKRKRSRKPQAPYTTSKLQQEAFNRLGFSAVKTMRAAQGLYEGVELGDEGSVGLITYMRTDSVNVAESAQKEAAEYIDMKYGKDYLPEKPPKYRAKKGAQEAHEAIRPSSVKRTPESIKEYLDDDAYKLYDLIWRKFVASQMNPAIDEQVSISIVSAEKYFFKATGRRNLFPGFGIVLAEAKQAKKEKDEDKEEKESSADELPDLKEGDILSLDQMHGNQHFTKPPPRYNDASLVKVLEEQGIGRPSTYAPTLYTLIYREYVGRNGTAIVPTELGDIVCDLLVEHFPNILDVEFTAKMEEELDKIEEGDLEWKSVLKEFYGPFHKTVEAAQEAMKNFRREVIPTEHICEECGKNLVIKWGRFGKFLACPGFPDCKFTRSLPTGHFCPEEGCGGELVKRKSKKRRTFYGCSNYPKCNYIVNKLPKKDETMSEDDRMSEKDRETLDP